MPIFTGYKLGRPITNGPFFANATAGGENYSIPMTLQNAHCQQFLADWIAGKPVFDPLGAPFPYSLPNRATLGI